MRTLSFAIGLFLLMTPLVLAQVTTDAQPIKPRPPLSMPVEHEAWFAELLAELDAAENTVIEQGDFLLRLSSLYLQQSSILEAQAANDDFHTEQLLEEAMTDLKDLMRYANVVHQPRFRELYRTLVTEFETHYGQPDNELELAYGEVFDMVGDMFAALNENDVPLLEDITLPEIRPMATTIPMTMHALVEKSLVWYLRHPKHVNLLRSRAVTYFPMIEQILAEEGVPDELKYLAMVESALNPRANSWASAGGMWQFIRATGRAYGLNGNHWMDERMDPEKATRAAARHLRDLHQLFDGDWLLALSGYNCNPSRIKRALRRAEDRLGRKATFWDIYNDIPRETRNYVPSYIAVSLIVSNAHEFNLGDYEPGPSYEYDVVPIQGMMDLNVVADLAGTDVATIRALNPEIRRNMTPSVDGIYELRVPIGSGYQFLEGYPNAPRIEATFIEYHVRRGDTLGRIAQNHGTSVSKLKAENGLRSSRINIGQKLLIPILKSQTERSATQEELLVAQNATVRSVVYGRSATRPLQATNQATYQPAPVQTIRTTTPVETPTIERVAEQAKTEAAKQPTRRATTSSPPRGRKVTYRVRAGDTVGQIAEIYGIRASQIRSWNRVGRRSVIRINQNLTIYTERSDAQIEAAWQTYRGQATTSASTTTPAPPVDASSTYVVRRGDALYTIAQKFNLSVENLKQWNSLRSNQIKPGQRLRIKPPAPARSSR